MNNDLIEYRRTIQQLIQDIFKNNRKLKTVIMYGDMLDLVVQIKDLTVLTVIIDLDNFVDRGYVDKYFNEKFEVNTSLLIEKVNQTIINYKTKSFSYNILNFNLVIKSLGKKVEKELTFSVSY